MRAQSVSTVLMAAFFLVQASAASADKWQQAMPWYIELKRAAKYARIAISVPANRAQIDAEEVAAKRQLDLAAKLPLSDQERTTCTQAAKAVVDFIAAAKAGNTAGYELKKERWDELSPECLKAIQQLGKAKSDSIDLVVGDIRRSERLIRAAVETQDSDELVAQRRSLSANFRRIDEVSASQGARLSCTFANQTLLNMISDLSLPPARAVVAWQDDEREFRKYMTECERASGKR